LERKTLIIYTPKTTKMRYTIQLIDGTNLLCNSWEVANNPYVGLIVNYTIENTMQDIKHDPKKPVGLIPYTQIRCISINRDSIQKNNVSEFQKAIDKVENGSAMTTFQTGIDTK